NIGDIRAPGKHQGQGTGHFGDSAKVAFANPLNVKATFDAVRIPDHTDNRLPAHALFISRVRMRDNALTPGADQHFGMAFHGPPALRWNHYSVVHSVWATNRLGRGARRLDPHRV